MPHPRLPARRGAGRIRGHLLGAAQQRGLVGNLLIAVCGVVDPHGAIDAERFLGRDLRKRYGLRGSIPIGSRYWLGLLTETNSECM
jgi:hypothetical protein